MIKTTTSPITLWLIILVVGITWIRSGVGKILSGNFPQGLGKTLGYFASQNPFPWYKNILLKTAIPNSILMGNLIQWAEVISGLLLVVGVLACYFLHNTQQKLIASVCILFALSIEVVLNASFWFAAGWTGPSTESLNLFMFLVEIICFGSVLTTIL
jgi:uncharacterized membrane protein YphA (DoxX/SURF4 family)